MDRREFLALSAGASASLLPLSAHAADGSAVGTPLVKNLVGQIRVLMPEADGKPLDKERAGTLCARDLSNDPLPQRVVHADGRARIDLAAEPIQLSLRLKVPGFGEVYCWADNDGHGYTKPANVDFVKDAASTRARRIKMAAFVARRMGAKLDKKTQDYLATSAIPITDTRTAYIALAAGLHAGERISIAQAQRRISQFKKPRKEFLFGCLVSPYATLGVPFDLKVRRLFNFATASWYVWGPEQPVENRINYGRMDASIQWCRERDINPKGFGYCYMTRGATPEWLRAWPFEKILPEYERVVRQTMQRYAGKLEYAEIINEAHDKANLWKLSHAQVVELTKAVCKAAREGSSTVKRVINHCCLWAEYARHANADGSRRWSPYRYLSECVSAGTQFDVVGLQLYYPQVDIFEIERMLDRFASFKKPIHITEIATASEPGPDPSSMRPNTTAPGWHGPWSEETQSEWMEAIYTLVYSKSQFEAITWWDLADIPGHFWPHGGLLNADLSQKLAYKRLGELQRDWGVAKKKRPKG